MTPPVSRRRFFGLLSSGAAVAAAPPAGPPPRAWIIVAVNWEYNDEVTFPDGESPLPQLYYDQAAALAECRRLCDAFFAAQTPAEFEPDWEAYGFNGPRDGDETAVTWEQLRAAGFRDPYGVHELTVPGAVAHE